MAIRAHLEGRPRVCVVGAGFIGAEVAAACRARGLDVTVVEALAAPLAQVLPPELASACVALHLDHGVDLRCGTTVAGFEGNRRVEALRLDGGRRCPPTSSWWESGSSLRPDGWRPPGWPSTTGSCATRRWPRLFPASWRRATSPGGPMCSSGRPCGSSTGRTPSTRARRLPAAAARRGRGAAVRTRSLRLVRPVRDEDPNAGADQVR